jgi:hypothetical protein
MHKNVKKGMNVLCMVLVKSSERTGLEDFLLLISLYFFDSLWYEHILPFNKKLKMLPVGF